MDDPNNLNQENNNEILSDRCGDIVANREEIIFNKLRILFIDALNNRYEHYLENGVIQLHFMNLTHTFNFLYNKYYKLYFGNYLYNNIEDILYSYSNNLRIFCEYIGLENITRIKKEFPLFLEKQFYNLKNYAELTLPLYEYLIEHNGILPESLREQEEEQEGNPI